MNKYKAVIGFELHYELKSNSKVFSTGKNEFTDKPNSNVSPVDMAFPGVLPTVNKKCVKDAIKMATILNCSIPQYMCFDRKNYYYPDLPKGYQITQYYFPVGINGHVDIDYNGGVLRVDIHDIHLEEDTASMDHLENTTLINYNRAGVPLLELVTEPCISNANEAVAFLEYMRSVYQYCDISEADFKKGQARCDVNISIMEEDAKEFGTKVEIKGVNSFSSVRDAINYEIDRQIKLKEENRYDEVVQDTRRWDEETCTTIRMRSKADAIDYKYFADPNIPKYRITEELKSQIKEEIPRLRDERKREYISEYGLSEKDATTLVKERNVSDYFEKCIKLGIKPNEAANWINGNILSYLNKNEINIDSLYLTPEMLKFILDNINNGTISSKQAKDIFNKVLEEKKEPKNFISEENAQISDKDELSKIIDTIILDKQEQVIAYKSGKDKLFGFFVGEVMKASKGKANPVITNQILHEKLDD